MTEHRIWCTTAGCAPGRPCPPCAVLAAERHTSEPTRAWCAARGHPWSTYNRDLNRTYCRCGARQDDGEHEIDMDAIREIFHDHPAGEPCACYTRQEPRP